MENFLDFIKETRSIIGHSDVIASLSGTLAKGKLPNVMIFSGMHGIGKYKTAISLAQYISIKGRLSPDITESSIMKKVSAFSHSDVCLLSTDGFSHLKSKNISKDIQVEYVREMLKFLCSTTSESRYKVVIIDDANKMNVSAANACLKIMEDTPKNAYIIMIAENLHDILPTIRSRATIFQFHPPTYEQFIEIATIAFPDHINNVDIGNLYKISSGSLGFMQNMIKNGGMEMYYALDSIFSGDRNHDDVKSMQFLRACASNSEKWKIMRDICTALANEKFKQDAIAFHTTPPPHQTANTELYVSLFKIRDRHDEVMKMISLLHDADSLNLNKEHVISSILRSNANSSF